MGIKLELEAHQSSLPNGDARRLARKSQGEPTARDLPFPPGGLATASNPEFEEMVEKLWNKIFP
ncbi:hypothetical protein HGRIS_011956 [Hohenbuehelia grisea]|uniref:Uncharacterized protein n=1 Tax=Hohenbuehelia grisea TaxID=104357 RepID=A0ABR3JYX2_9AGAR